MPSASTPTVPRKGYPNSRVGTFTQALYDEAKKKGWTVISMKETGRRSSDSTREECEGRVSDKQFHKVPMQCRERL